MSIGTSLRTLRETHERFGFACAIQYFLHALINKFIYFDRLHIIVLTRDKVRPLKAKANAQLTSRFATLQDLEEMSSDPRWDVGASKIAYFKAGDSCLLSYANGELTGYTWAHTLGRPELLPGLVISVPDDYLYNYAGLTLPEARGLGLQPYRHHALLNNDRWQTKKGLLGFVKHMNFASRHGQGKSGYRTIGSIWMIGRRTRFRTYFSRTLREMGIRRLSSDPPASSPDTRLIVD
jgi:hypothetical protein